ncbi:phosphate ABC transporter permease PstA [Caldanaerobius polysaccharolyticus]|uniref:phosphate ABC transporter permease PstA n=1 Tax=Caldanaerobius polysaccharolyticus TaxID=44256 RepID=UPI000478BFF5|nr:phosphate ABC transporter permease PstA [Caldanaerobius polysaccharolyticus]
MNAKIGDKVATVFFSAVAAFVILLLFAIIGYILFNGLEVVNWHFISTPPTFMKAGGGIAPQLFNSILLLVVSMIITVPIGLGAGIYLSEFAKPGPLTDTIRVSIESLASLPSIVVGLFGLIVFVKAMGWGFSIVAGAMALAVLNLPVMTRVSEDAIRSVSNELREASFALGATEWQTITRVLIKAALPSLITGIILTAARVFGEAAALLYTAGMSTPILDFQNWNPAAVNSPLRLFRPGETLAVYIWKVNSEGLVPDAARIANGASAVLVICVLLFNLISRWLGKIIYRKITGD